MADRLLRLYLNDHLAGAVGGLELAKRSYSNNRGTPLGDALARLVEDIDDDVKTLERVMRELGVGFNRPKQAASWAVEKLGRFKANGKLVGYSPLSRLVELETLRLGVEGKACLWRSLLQVHQDYPALDNFDLPELLARAESQRDKLEKYRQEAAADALRG